MALDTAALYVLIIGCEVAFWAVLAAGLACRYIWKMRPLGKLLLICVPLIDVVLLGLTVLDLRHGATATFAHGLAMAYVGFTVAFGPTMMRWADHRFAHRFAGGPPPPAPPQQRLEAVWMELKLWGLCLVAVGIIYVLLTGVIELVDQPDRTQALQHWYGIPLSIAVLWFLFGPVWELVFFRQPMKAT
jgi:hypothetical protein